MLQFEEMTQSSEALIEHFSMVDEMEAERLVYTLRGMHNDLKNSFILLNRLKQISQSSEGFFSNT